MTLLQSDLRRQIVLELIVVVEVFVALPHLEGQLLAEDDGLLSIEECLIHSLHGLPEDGHAVEIRESPLPARIRSICG